MELALESVKSDMLSLAPGIDITCIAEEESSFTDSLEKIARQHNVDMIIMGITGATSVAQILMGSSTLSMVNRNVCPVMIVPPDAVFTGIKKVVITSDFKEVEKTIPAVRVQALLSIFNPFVHVVNVDSEHYVEITEEYKTERAKLDAMLSNFDRDYSFIRLFDFTDAINQFVSDYHIDMIITIPKHHSFLGGLFKSSHTKRLAYHSHVPLIAIHE